MIKQVRGVLRARAIGPGRPVVAVDPCQKVCWSSSVAAVYDESIVEIDLLSTARPELQPLIDSVRRANALQKAAPGDGGWETGTYPGRELRQEMHCELSRSEGSRTVVEYDEARH